MLNKSIIMGRITAPLEIRQTQSGLPVLQFTVAVDRYTKQGEEKKADFITCVAWRQTAEFIARYFGKGRMIALTGHLQSRTYDDKNGSRHYITELIVDEASFTGEPKQDNQGGGYNNGYSQGYDYQQNNGGGYQPNNGGYQQSGNYQQGGNFQQNNGGYMQAPQEFNDMEVFSDDGVPF